MRLQMRGSRFTLFGLIHIAAMLSVGCEYCGSPRGPCLPAAAGAAAASPALCRRTGDSPAFEQVARRLRDSVVHVHAAQLKVDSPVPASGGVSSAKTVDGVDGFGSGIIVSDDGYILTNSHLVRGARGVQVKLADGSQYAAEVLAADAHTEVSVLKVDAAGLTAAELGDSDAVTVGSWVLAMGNPFGLEHSVTAGIISGKGRANLGIAGQEEFLQTDAAINPGNSGGPLVDLQGRVIGINTAIASHSGGSMGIGFAVPINMARAVWDAILLDGGLRRGWLGVSTQELTRELAESFDHDEVRGALIADVASGSPAAAAGLEPGDIVVRFHGEVTEDGRQLRHQVAVSAPDTVVDAEVIRAGKREVIRVRLSELPEMIAASAVPRVAESDPGAAAASPGDIGAVLQNLTPELAEHLRIQDLGVLVTGVLSDRIAAAAGLKPGDLIVAVGTVAVRDLDEFRRQMEAHDLTRGVRLQVRSIPDKTRRFVVLKSPR